MADTRRYLPNQSLDLQQILEEAKHRWLRPTEILQILSNYSSFTLTSEPPNRPSAGSLLLLDRKELRYFRKDGHRWRKKKDGKTVKEAHEKLKAGSVDVLHCYYAHGEDNDNFQRRSYWMLDGKFEHIVLVHYREVKEGYRSGASHLLSNPSPWVDASQPSCAPSFTQTASSCFTSQSSYVSSPNGINWNGQILSSKIGDADPRNNLGASSHTEPIHGHISHGNCRLSKSTPGSLFVGHKVGQSTVSSLCPETGSSAKSADYEQDQKLNVGEHTQADFIIDKLTDSRLNSDSKDNATLIFEEDDQAVAAVSQRSIQEHNFNLIHPCFLNYSGSQKADLFGQPKDATANNGKLGELNKLDSFGRWMDKMIGGDCDDSFMASDSGNYWNTLDTGNEEKEVSSLSHHMQLDIDSLGPSLSQDQLFSIRDFSPDWTYSGVETKVLVVGIFLGSKKFSSESKWGCMFGEIEVSAEVLTDNVIRCQAPLHASGRVPFYITCRDRLACSEVREFVYRENLSKVGSTFSRSVEQEEPCLVARLAKLSSLGAERKWLNCSIEGCYKCKLKNTLCSKNYTKKDLARLGEDSMVSEVEPFGSRDDLIQSLLRDRLCEWLVCRVHEGGNGPDVLDNGGLGVIHLAASLGYEWAMGLIVAASNNPNFRDAQGRTALHWASYFGREETVIALIRLGADPTAVDDPTSSSPGGRIAADLASIQGHKGIAGYLAEAFLTRHLLSLNIKENSRNSVDATIAAEQATETAEADVGLSSDRTVDDELSLKGSLAAVRKSALAAALIQEAYRSHSFQYRQLSERNDDSEVSLDLAVLGSLNKDHRRSHYEDYLHSAAVKIQQKYRGWRGRREFLMIRNRIVKIQAHVRGRQVHRQYKKVIWSVSVVEKAILRWRRKRPGLRGFCTEKETGDAITETDKTDDYEFLRISRKQKYAGVENALARVKSMVRDPAARGQYMRLLMETERLKISDE